MIIRDLVHSEIRLEDKELIRFIEGEAFQRLARLKQQGNTYRLLSGAVHTRYSHSLGVYAVMRRMLDALAENQQIVFSDEERRVALVSALLHDIGHGPFSHCFEAISSIHHEVWTVRIMEEHKPVRATLDRTPGLLRSVRSVIRRTGEHPLLEQLMGSPIGADAIDYHLRDLLHSGLPEKPFDLDALLSTLRICNGRLTITADGVPHVEDFVRIKRTLFEQSFNHPYVIEKDVLMKLIFKRASYLYGQGRLREASDAMIPVLDRDAVWPTELYIQLDDESVQEAIYRWFNQEDDLILPKLCEKYMADDREEIHWRVVERPAHALLEDEESSYTTAVYTRDEKYGVYKSGIWVEHDDGKLTDVRELSARIRNASPLAETHYLFRF